MFGDKTVRDFHVPKLNFQAECLLDLINWAKEPIFEPILTCDIKTDQLDSLLTNKLAKVEVECHTQSCERAIKITTEASSKVFGFENRDGYIRSQLKSRNLVSEITSKKSLFGMLN